MPVVVRSLVCAALLVSPGVCLAEPAQSRPIRQGEQSVRVYMRSDPMPLTFSARARSSTGTPVWCIAPCDVALSPGDYRLKLNGVTVDDPVEVRTRGTLHGELQSREGLRSTGWLAMNVGGIVGGVFITVGILGGASWTYVAGGGTLAAGGLFLLATYRTDRATVSFTPDEPLDVRGMPAPSNSGASSEGARDQASRARGLGFRVAF